MKAIILAAGVASRLRPLTNNTPKCLLKIGEKTILERMIDNLIANRIEEFVIVTGFLEAKIRHFIQRNYPNLQVSFINNELYDSTNNIYSLWLVKQQVIADEMLLLDSDILFDKNIVGLLLKSDYPNCLALRSGKIGDEEMKVSISEKGNITAVNKNMDTRNAIGESIGIEKFSNELLLKLFEVLDRKMLIDKQVNQWYESAFEEIMDKGCEIYPIDVGTLKCAELDTIEDFRWAETELIPFL